MEFKRNCPNEGCSREITYNRKDSYKNAINKNTICAKCNRLKRGSVYNKFLNDKIVNKILNIYYDKTKILTEIAIECEISFETLNKIIKLENLPQIKRDSKVIDREASYRKIFKTKYGIDYDEFIKDKPIFDRYKNKVKYLTTKTVKKFHKYIFNIDKIGKGENDYHIDHIVSIKDCFLNNIDPSIASDIINLRAIPRNENLSKGSNSIFTAEILLHNVNERNNNKIKI
jgi:hypothetical protein